MNENGIGPDGRLPAPPRSEPAGRPEAGARASESEFDEEERRGAPALVRAVVARVARPVVLIGVGVALLLAAIAATAFVLLRGSTANLTAWVPSDAEIAAVAYLDPATGQKVNLAQLTDAFPGVTGPTDFGRQLEEWGDDALDDLGLRFDDVAGWLGVEVALVADVEEDVSSVAVLAHVEDRDGAELMLAKLQAPGAPWEGAEWHEREHLGVTLTVPDGDVPGLPAYAFDDDVLIVASEPRLIERILDTHHELRPSVRTNVSYQESQAELPGSALLTAFVDVGSLADAVDPTAAAGAASSISGLGDMQAVRSIGIALTAEPDGLALDVVASFDAANLTGALREQLEAEDHTNALLRSIPARTWGVLAAEHVDLGIEAALDELRDQDPGALDDLDDAGLTGPDGLLDLLTGDMAVAVAPGRQMPVGGAMLVGVTDQNAARQAVERLAAAIAEQIAGRARRADISGWERTAHPDGTTITFAPRAPIAFALRDDVLILGTSVEQVAGVLDTSPTDSLAADPAFERGTSGVPTTDALFYADIGRVITSIRDALPAEDRAEWDPELARDLRTVRSIAFGVDANTDREWIRMFLAIPGEDAGSAPLPGASPRAEQE
jgi:hypothetical protein